MAALKKKVQKLEHELRTAKQLVKSLQKDNASLTKQLDKISKKKASRKKRKPSAYNLFVKAELARLKKSHPNVPHPQKFKMATDAWKRKKG